MIAFLVLGFVFGLAYPRHRAQVAVGVVVCALALEAAQRLVAGRHGELADALVKATGGLIGVVAVDLAQRMTPKDEQSGAAKAGSLGSERRSLRGRFGQARRNDPQRHLTAG